MSAGDAETVDVAIVGAGPTGLVLAILLAQRGHQVVVIERFEQPYPLPRAVHFDHEVARILQSVGVADDLEGFTEPAPIYEWRNAEGEILLRFGREREAGLSGWPDSNMTHQPRLEAALERRARAFAAVAILRGHDVDRLASAGEGVEIGGRRADGAPFALRARHVVGCDGANSFVRRALGAGWHDLGFAYDWLVVDVIPRDARIWSPLNWQLCDPERPTTLVSGGPGRRRFEFMRLPGEPIESLASPETVWRLLARWDVDPANATLERHAVYTFRAAWADRWRQGRISIAGDAAHLMPPFAGQGMCSGIRDAANLAWKLDLVLDGLADEALLESYESERAPHARQTIDFSVGLGRVICTADPAEAATRDAQMIPAARAAGITIPPPAPKLGPGCWQASDPRAGGLFLQARVRHAGRIVRLDDAVGGGRFALVARDAELAGRLTPERRAWLASIGAVCLTVGPGTPFEDVEGAYARWFAAQGCAVALQRPDFALFGTARDATGLNGLVDALRQALTSATRRPDTAAAGAPAATSTPPRPAR